MSTSLSGMLLLMNPFSSQKVYFGHIFAILQVYQTRFISTVFLNVSEMTLLSADLNTYFKWINLPIQTSPNCPAPSFFTNLIDSRGISHASLSHGFWGLGLIQAFSNFLHRPSDCSGFQSKNKIQNLLHLCASQLEAIITSLQGCSNQLKIMFKPIRCLDENRTFLVFSHNFNSLWTEI